MKNIRSLAVLLICLMIFTLSSCGQSKNKDVELTLDNYETYFKLDGYWNFSGNSYKGEQSRKAYDSISYGFSAEGNEQYIYNDVKITVRVNVSYYPPKYTGSKYGYGLASGTSRQNISQENYIEIWNGKGECTGTITPPGSNKFLSGSFSGSTSTAITDLNYEVVSVEGTATPRN